jgi:ATP-binding cassette, subfamily B, bacterial PglK
MKKTRTLVQSLLDFWRHIPTYRKKQSILFLLFTFISALTEVISVGAILPFLGALTAPEELYGHELIVPIVNLLSLNSPKDLLLPLAVFFILIVLVSGAIRLSLLYILTRFSYATGVDISVDIYRRVLYQDYLVHVSQHSSKIINGITNKTAAVIHGILTPLLVLISASFLLIGIIVFIIFIDPLIAMVIFTCFGGMYFFIAKFSRRKLKLNSEKIANESSHVIKSLQESLGGIRDVVIENNQEFYCDIYRKSDAIQRRAQGENHFIGDSPRYIVEAIGIIIIAISAYFMSLRDSGIVSVVPVLGVIVLGAQRMLPAFQQIYGALTNIRGSQASLYDVLELLNQPIPNYKSRQSLVSFKRQISLKKVFFQYSPERSTVLKNINLDIKKGECVGFIGSTGGGKSTLIDIIMGLLVPSDGSISIDNRILTKDNINLWRANIAHVPQNIFLSDATIMENIAFGIQKEKINVARVKRSAELAQLSDTINMMPEGYQTVVGENGLLISGGQRQRIGIARAMYKKSDIIIFDEATSSLDSATEKLIMDSIKKLDHNTTILMIAHRLTTLKSCKKIIIVEDGVIAKVTTYDDLKECN